METVLPRLYTTKELARMLGESEWAIQDWVRRRGLPVIKIGNRNRFDLAQVRAWLEAGGDRSSDRLRYPRPDAAHPTVNPL